jgi:hypothetical protein
MTQEEVFRVFDKFHIIYNCNIDQDGTIRLRNELNILSDDQYNNIRNLYYEKFFSPDKLSLIYNTNIEKFRIHVSDSWCQKSKVTDSDFNQLLLETQDNPDYFISRKIAKDIIEQYLISNRFKRKILDECWEKQTYSNPRQDLLNKVTTYFVNSSDVLKKVDLIQIYKEFEDIILIEKDITDELNKFIRLNSLFPENEKLSPRYPKSYLIVTDWTKKIVDAYPPGAKPEEEPIVRNEISSTSQTKQDNKIIEEEVNNELDNLIKIADKALLNEEVDIALENYQEALKINPANTYVLGQINKINILINTHIERIKIEIQQDLLDLYNFNKPNKLTFEQLFVFYELAKENSPFPQTEIENEINKFINNNNLVPENKPLPSILDYTVHCSNNWIKKPNLLLRFLYNNFSILKQILFFLAISVCIGLAFKYFYNPGILYHTIAIDGANIRSSPDVSSDANIKDKIVYGQTFKIDKETDVEAGFGGMWLKDDGIFSDRYVSSKIFVTEKDFYLLESIFGDETTKQAIKTVKCRKALIDYYKRQDSDYRFFGKIDDITYKKVYGKPKDFIEEWQVFCTDFVERSPNSIVFPRAYDANSKFTDFGFIVTNVSTYKKTFVLYTYDDITEEPFYVAEIDANGHNLVKNVSVSRNGLLNVIFAD